MDAVPTSTSALARGALLFADDMVGKPPNDPQMPWNFCSGALVPTRTTGWMLCPASYSGGYFLQLAVSNLSRQLGNDLFLVGRPSLQMTSVDLLLCLAPLPQ